MGEGEGQGVEEGEEEKGEMMVKTLEKNNVKAHNIISCTMVQ